MSRPVVHEGLVDLAAKGLVTLKPRVGTVVNDFRKEGSLAILNSIINYQQGEIDESCWKACCRQGSWWKPKPPGLQHPIGPTIT